jgi:ketosteroid isomerase-like protein
MNTVHRFTFISATVLAIGLLALMPYQPIAAQNPTPAPTTASSTSPTATPLPDEESLHQELRGMKKIYEDAVNSGDLKTLAPVFGPQTSGVVATNEEFHTLDDMQQIFDRFKSTLGPGYIYRVTLNPERSLIYGDIAVCRGTSDEYIKSGSGNEFKLQTRWTAVLRRENGQWHLLRSQVSMDPFHNPVSDYFFALTKKVYGGGGLAIGLIVGILIGYIVRGRRIAV